MTALSQTDDAARERPGGRSLLTRADCDVLEEAGQLSKWYELVDGEIIEKKVLSRPHYLSHTRVFSCLLKLWPDQAYPRVLLEVSEKDRLTNFPQPNAFVSVRPIMSYNSDVCGTDTLLVVEVSDPILHRSITKKVPVYARAGVRELWVLDVSDRVLLVHRSPTEGAYAEVVVVIEHDTISPIALPEKEIRVGDLLPPALVEVRKTSIK